MAVAVQSSFGFVARAGALFSAGAVVACAGVDYTDHLVMLVCLDFLNLVVVLRYAGIRLVWKSGSLEVSRLVWISTYW